MGGLLGKREAGGDRMALGAVKKITFFFFTKSE